MPDPKLPITIDFGASARAEIKTEIPANSSGRLLDALTDAIRPFTERRGLKADMIRLQREEVLIEIARRARQRIALEGGLPRPVPNKFLIPFLEAASLEEADSELVALWAGLLVSESLHGNPNHVHFVSILGQLSGDHCRLLRAVMRNVTATDPAIFVCIDREIELDWELDGILQKWGGMPIEEVEEAARVLFTKPGISSCHIGISDLGTWDFYEFEFGEPTYTPEQPPLYAVLTNFGILKLIERSDSRHGRWGISLSCYVVTPLGVEFYVSCQGSRILWPASQA